jgi:hypothetical protein
MTTSARAQSGRTLRSAGEAARFVALIEYQRLQTLGGTGGRSEVWSDLHSVLASRKVLSPFCFACCHASCLHVCVAPSTVRHAPWLLGTCSAPRWQDRVCKRSSKTTEKMNESGNQGDVEEHALLLCSLLLGFRFEAYCAIGTTISGDAHMWVVTLQRPAADDFSEPQVAALCAVPLSLGSCSPV